MFVSKVILAAFIYFGSCWYFYSIGWWKGNTEGIRWTTEQIYPSANRK